jgi:hypothetical protein
MSDYSPLSPQMPVRVPTNDVAAVPTRPTSLAAIISRIEEAVDKETASISTDVKFDIKASNARKSRYLYELTKALKSIDDQAVLLEHRDSIVRLREKLATNEAVILAHLNAVSEVATILQNAIQHAEADGTYCAGEFGMAR